ncbi:hypothetical protein H7142_02300 [Candidatus Saccharibacteria bacterium]|nr:hypothetical protein [Candidatus Saccharibacteria bacterium]
MTQLNEIGLQLVRDLKAARSQKLSRSQSHGDESKMHVVGAGATLTAAYEQLRNAAEYAEEHVLLQRAIRRFYRRIFVLREAKLIESSGEELIIELTHAGYLANDSVSEQDVQYISALAKRYYEAYTGLMEQKNVHRDEIDHWTYELLAVEVEWRLNDNGLLQAFTQFAHNYFSATIDYEQVFSKKPDSVEISLYIAVHRALLKSDDASLRLGLLKRYQQEARNDSAFIEINRQIDTMLASDATEKLFRLVDRRGAPLRVLRHMIDENADIDDLLGNRDQTLLAFERQVGADYKSINARVNNGIIKSVIFLIITKFLIGIAIEVPYDYLIFGMILWLPLIINLFFPPLYMILLRATMLLPGPANTLRLVEQIDATMYGSSQQKLLVRRPGQEFGTGYNVVYGLLFAAVFGGVAALLWHFLDFDIMHLLIFFVFLSAASFLGFRLSRMIREIESLETHQNGVTLIRDFLYMPFVVVGRFLSDKYSKVNVVALALDMLIELPLKTILRLVRQWAAFISAKKDQL